MDTIFHFTIDCDWIPNSEKSLPRLFEIIEKFNIKPTFFLTGKFVEQYKEFVVEMKNRNYEIGCHGLNHGLDLFENFGNKVSYLDQKRILSRSTEIIYNATGIAPIIFRAPRLKTSDDTFKVLSELNYKMDSSIPARRFDFGLGCTNGIKHFFKESSTFYINDSILEIPPSAYILPLNMRLIRIFGADFALNLVNIIRHGSNLIVFYIHPAEFISNQKPEYTKREKYFFKNCGTQNYLKLESFLAKVIKEKVLFEKMSIHITR